MKSHTSIIILLSLFLQGFVVAAQDNTEEKLNLPGDNLNLYAVMDLFRESETLEGFEKNLNSEDSKINNLDLNNDGKIDYIKVIDNVDGDVHTIVLQVAINEKENQDVAVFTVQKDNNGQVLVQLIGDEELYGKDYIIEPNYNDASTKETPNPGYAGNNNSVQNETVAATQTTYVEAANWPVVTYIYVPTYVVWRSPWYWGYYPPYWHPWSPFYWDYYYGYHSHYQSHYYGYYHHSNYNRYPQYNNNYYYGHRSYSNTVNQNRQSGMYKNTYSRPETRQQGSADFNKKYPDGYRPTVKPDNNTNTRPTSQPATRPTNPSRYPNTGNPSTRPATTTPSTRPDENRPTTRPATTTPSTRTDENRPTTRPATTTPSTSPYENRPTTRPATTTPSTSPDENRPITRPATTTPSTRPDENRPSTRPATTTPSTRPDENRPSTRPTPTTPTSKPATTKPATKPNPSRSTSKDQDSKTDKPR